MGNQKFFRGLNKKKSKKETRMRDEFEKKLITIDLS